MIKTLLSFILILNSAFGASVFIDLEGIKVNSGQKVSSPNKVLSVENKLNSGSIVQIFKNNSLFKTIVLKTGESKSVKLPRGRFDKFHVIGVKPPTEKIDI